MTRQWYKVTTTFTYKNGMAGGRLSREVNSKKAISVQHQANRTWLTVKGHKEVETVVEPCDNPNKR